jgi:DNA replicative helicase MCM subunit Mcm2 (Cdc46/Mcm family)
VSSYAATHVALSNTDVHLRDQLKENALLKKFYCDIDIGDLIKYNEELAHRMVSEPADIIPLVRKKLLAMPHYNISNVATTVRSSIEEMYTPYPLSPRPQGSHP